MDGRERRRLVSVCVAGTALVATFFVVALERLGAKRWYPLLDMALTEMRVRDVFTSSPPTVGLIGRIGTGQSQGSHPGPISFYLLAPVYKVLGSTAFALSAAQATLSVVVVVLIVVLLARNSTSLTVILAVGSVLMVLYYVGADVAVTPWNPYFPILWFMLLLVACWAIAEGDAAGLPIAVLAACACTQTHVSYALIVLAPVVATLVLCLRRTFRWRNQSPRWQIYLGSALVVGGVAWAPALWQQVTASRTGNLSIVWNYFTHPPSNSIGLSDGARLFLSRLDLAAIFQHRLGGGDPVPGLLLLLVWATIAGLTIRSVGPSIVRFNVILGASMVAGMVSASRIFGPKFYYLTLWGAVFVPLMLMSIIWTATLFIRRVGPRATRLSYAVCVGIVGGIAVAGFVGAAGATRSRTWDSSALSSVTGPVDRYLTSSHQVREVQLTWTDPIGLGGTGYGLMNELERAHIRAQVDPALRIAVGDKRIVHRSAPPVEVHLAMQPSDIAKWRARKNARELGYFDPRSRPEALHSLALKRIILQELSAGGGVVSPEDFDTSTFVYAFDPRVSAETRQKIQAYMSLGLPSAVFVKG